MPNSATTPVDAGDRISGHSITLVDLTRGDLLLAGTLAGRLRSNDALHLTTALRVGANDMISYDEELLSAGRAAGLTPVRPT